MALKTQASFSAGEIDPALHERTTLQKYDSGLATARNVYIGKSGRIISRPGRKHYITTKNSGERCILFEGRTNFCFIEWGNLYVRVHFPFSGGGGYYEEHAHTSTEAQLPDISFTEDRDGNIYVFLVGGAPRKIITAIGATSLVTTAASLFYIPTKPSYVSDTLTGAGYAVDYAFTVVIGGQESAFHETSGALLPITAGTSNTWTMKVGAATDASIITEMRVYRRPTNGGVYGYVGSSSYFFTSGADRRSTFVDVGQAADYTNSPPTQLSSATSRGLSGPAAFLSRTGLIYQGRLLLSYNDSIEASRTGYANNFYRDYPYTADSALSFRSGSSGYAKVLRMIDSDGLVVFTDRGVFTNFGPLGPTNLSLDRRGSYVIDYRVPPIVVPGGVLFVDQSSNVIRQLIFSDEANTYLGQETSIFSNHLFVGKRIVSWAYEEGVVALLWVVFDDGSFASFTYEKDQEMRAWTRHDFSSDDLKVEWVIFDGVYTRWIVNKDGARSVETGLPRFLTETTITNPEIDKGEIIAYMDSIVSWSSLINDDLVGADTLDLTPVVPDDWEGQLTLTCGTSALFTAGTRGAVGTIFRYFNPDDGSSVDLEVISRTSDNEVVVEAIDVYFPSDYASDIRLYDTATTFTGLDHLDDEEVSVIVDGYVVASPNNDIEHYDLVIPSGGSITLPGGLRGAIVHIGRPITGDVETLDIATVEQRPVLIESQTVNKVYVKVHKARGLYVGNNFPTYNRVNGMEDVDSIQVDYEADDEIITNRYQPPVTRRVEVTIPGDWKSNGRVCIRQCDPLHFEILSIIADTEDLRR